MERTRFFRRPVIWIILVIAAAIAASSFFTGGPSYHRVETSVVLDRLNSGGIKNAVYEDKEQTLQLELNEKATFDKTTTDRIETQVPYEVSDDIWPPSSRPRRPARSPARSTPRSRGTVCCCRSC